MKTENTTQTQAHTSSKLQKKGKEKKTKVAPSS
jgi:hypothetical protein